jgi:hypothetical protein
MESLRDWLNNIKHMDLDSIQLTLESYSAWGPLPGILLPFIESFLPFLPLILIIAASANIYGLGFGFLFSWIGVTSGAVCVFWPKFQGVAGETLSEVRPLLRLGGTPRVYPAVPACLLPVHAIDYYYGRFGTKQSAISYVSARHAARQSRHDLQHLADQLRYRQSCR